MTRKSKKKQQGTRTGNREEQTGTLRFMVGDNVKFKRKDTSGWHAGTVEELWYRNAKWPDSHPSYPYRVEQKSRLPQGQMENMVNIENDTDAYIRVMTHSQAPTTAVLYGDVPLPEPEDPLDYLYQPFPENEAIQFVAAILHLKDDSKSGTLEPVQDLANGGIKARVIPAVSATASRTLPGAHSPITNSERSTILFIPNLGPDTRFHRQEPIDNILHYIIPRIELRRPVGHCGKYNAEQIFHSIFPSEPSIAELQKTIRNLETEQTEASSPFLHHHVQERCQKLLNLGDALLFLFRPLDCNRDFERANKCYEAASFDIAEEEVQEQEQETFGHHLEGLPEAMCAHATTLHYSTERLVYAHIHNLDPSRVKAAVLDRSMLDTDQIILEVLKHQTMMPQIVHNISVTLYLLVSALKRGWFSVLAYQYAKALSNDALNKRIDSLWSHPIDQKIIRHLRDAHRHQQVKRQIQEEKMAKTRITQHGIPSIETVMQFAPKALDILRCMPVHFCTPGPSHNILRYMPVHFCTPGLPREYVNTSFDLHISFFELQIPSSPVCVLIFCPNTLAQEFLRIPDELQLFPFSEKTFEWVWHRIAYMIHLGFRKPSNAHTDRVRPKAFKLKNVGGDLHFANFLQIKCFQLPGTQVELLEVDEDSEDEMGFHDQDHDLWWVRKSGIHELQKEEAARQPCFFSKLNPSSKSILAMMRQSPPALVAETPEEVGQVMKEVYTKKSIANKEFNYGRFEISRKYYEAGISLLRRIRDPAKKEVFQLMGSLLSNHAICGIEIAKQQIPTYGSFTLKEVVAVCDVALANSMIIAASSENILAKLRFRRDLASNRQPAVDPAFIHRSDELRGALAIHIDIEYNLRIFLDDDTNTKNEASENKITIMLGKDISKSETICPMCTDNFSTRLANKPVIQLQCSHLNCAKCFFSYKRAIPENSNMTCSLCRREVEDSLFRDALKKMVESRTDMQERLSSLPLNCPADRFEVIRSLLLRHDLDLDAVLRSVDDMLYLNNCGSFWQSKNLSSMEKQTIYDDARRPVQILEQEFKDTQELLDIGILDSDSIKFKQTRNKLKDIEQRLHSAKDNAEKEIFSRVNASGSMGMENDNGEIQLDFHGLHVKEAKDKLENMVLPIIPFVKSLIIITGRGLHSANNKSKLKPALQTYLTQKHKSTIEWEVVKKNPGAIRIRYNEAQSELLN